jgi:hypothetical protein
LESTGEAGYEQIYWFCGNALAVAYAALAGDYYDRGETTSMFGRFGAKLRTSKSQSPISGGSGSTMSILISILIIIEYTHTSAALSSSSRAFISPIAIA